MSEWVSVYVCMCVCSTKENKQKCWYQESCPAIENNSHCINLCGWRERSHAEQQRAREQSVRECSLARARVWQSECWPSREQTAYECDRARQVAQSTRHCGQQPLMRYILKYFFIGKSSRNKVKRGCIGAHNFPDRTVRSFIVHRKQRRLGGSVCGFYIYNRVSRRRVESQTCKWNEML